MAVVLELRIVPAEERLTAADYAQARTALMGDPESKAMGLSQAAACGVVSDWL